MDLDEFQQYFTLAITAFTLAGLVFGFTPKGFPALVAVYNLLSTHVFHKSIYVELARLDTKIDNERAAHDELRHTSIECLSYRHHLCMMVACACECHHVKEATN